jgi:hypothetical protein
MILNVICLCCGKKGKVLIIKHRIISLWAYFGKVVRPIDKSEIDYWECPKCKRN